MNRFRVPATHEVSLLEVHRRRSRRARPRGAAVAAVRPAALERLRRPVRDADGDDDGHSMQSLHDAIMEALLNGGLLSDETLERLLGKDWQTSEDAEAAARRADSSGSSRSCSSRATSRRRPDLERNASAGGRGRRRSAAPKRRSSSRSPTRASTFSAIARCAICWDRSARAASAGTTRARWRPASRRAARRSRTSSATR